MKGDPVDASRKQKARLQEGNSETKNINMSSDQKCSKQFM